MIELLLKDELCILIEKHEDLVIHEVFDGENDDEYIIESREELITDIMKLFKEYYGI